MAIKELITKAISEAKLIATTLTLIAATATGAWTFVSDVFIPRVEAEIQYKRLDIETSYNKAFRLEQRVERLDRIKTTRELSEEENKAYYRYLRQLEEVDEHIYTLETKLFESEERNE